MRYCMSLCRLYLLLCLSASLLLSFFGLPNNHLRRSRRVQALHDMFLPLACIIFQVAPRRLFQEHLLAWLPAGRADDHALGN